MSDPSYPPLYDSVLPNESIRNTEGPLQSTYTCYAVFITNRLAAVRTTHAAAAEDAYQLGGRVYHCTLIPYEAP